MTKNSKMNRIDKKPRDNAPIIIKKACFSYETFNIVQYEHKRQDQDKRRRFGCAPKWIWRSKWRRTGLDGRTCRESSPRCSNAVESFWAAIISLSISLSLSLSLSIVAQASVELGLQERRLT